VAYEPPEHAAENEELGHDVAGREPERLTLTCMVANERRQPAAAAKALRLGVAQVLGKLSDKGGHVAELGDPAKTRKRRNRVVS
jgi:hypothetical protein